jgi:hypothetical protein
MLLKNNLSKWEHPRSPWVKALGKASHNLLLASSPSCRAMKALEGPEDGAGLQAFDPAFRLLESAGFSH